MANVKDFTLTKHAIERLRQRKPAFAKEVDKLEGTAIKKKATYEYFYGAKEDRSFLNNSVFMTMLGEKYGFEKRYSLFMRDDMVFVGITNEDGNLIVTTLNRDTHRVSHVRAASSSKFKRKG